jgi:hypothetical protein
VLYGYRKAREEGGSNTLERAGYCITSGLKSVRVAAYSGEGGRAKIDWLVVLPLHILGIAFYVSV